MSMPAGQGDARRLVLTVTCPDRPGIVAAVTGFIAEHDGSVVEAAQYGDLETGQFFQRIEILADSLRFGADEFPARFAEVAGRLDLRWTVRDTAVKRRVVLLVSKMDHCLADLLHQWRSGDLVADIPLVISNHPDLGPLVEWYGIEFRHIPFTDRKPEAFAEVAELFDQVGGEVMVLARFMQILPPELCERYPQQIINIHHSFLPSFVGAKPYHQAMDRGVKLIGATCHYVTNDLDEGPIIEQDVGRIDHAHSIDDLLQIGRGIERSVLARGLRWHLEDRVLLNGHRTVVFT